MKARTTTAMGLALTLGVAPLDAQAPRTLSLDDALC